MFSAAGSDRDRWRDAARVALQATTASVSTWMVLRWIESPEIFVGIISAVLVVQETVDHTVARARDRIAATAFGSAVGVGCLLVLPAGIATPLALAISMAVINAVATLRSGWRYGAVAAIALSLSSEQSVVDSAVDRLLAIGVGAGIGLLVSLVVWPESAGNRAGRHLNSALSALGDQLEHSMDTVGDTDGVDVDPSGYHRHIERARSATTELVGDDHMVQRRLTATNRLYNSVLMLRRVVDQSGELTGIDELDAAIGALQEDAHRIVIDLADERVDEVDHTELLDDVGHAIERARTALDVADDDPGRRTHRHALLFAVEQLERSLSDLVDSYVGNVDESTS